MLGGGLLFLSSWPLYFRGGIIFKILFHFLLCQMCQLEGFKFYLEIKNNEALPLDLASLECLSVQSLTDLP